MYKGVFSKLENDKKEILVNFLKRGEIPDTIKTIYELEGFLYGVVISDVLFDELFDEVVANRKFENEKEREAIRTIIYSAYSHLLDEFDFMRLEFPFKITPKNLTEELEKAVQQWCLGFYYALNLRPDIWKLEYMDENSDLIPPDELLPHILNLEILYNLAFAQDIPKMYGEFHQDPNIDINKAVLAYSYYKIEEVINYFIDYAESMQGSLN